MEIEIIHSRLKEKRWYHGVITRHKVKGGKLIIYVKLKKDPENEYIRSIEINQNENSFFVKMAQDLEIINNQGHIDTDILDELHVKATLHRGSDSCLYIYKICKDCQCYSEISKEEDE